jgi:hypothetical protein
MPASLEELCIADHQRFEENPELLAGLFDGMSEMKKERLIDSKSIAFRDWEIKIPLPVDGKTKAICEEASIEKLLIKGFSEYYSEEDREAAFIPRDSGGGGDEL